MGLFDVWVVDMNRPKPFVVDTLGVVSMAVRCLLITDLDPVLLCALCINSAEVWSRDFNRFGVAPYNIQLLFAAHGKYIGGLSIVLCI